MKTNYIIFFLLFIFINGTVYYFTSITSKNKIDMVLDQNIEILETHYHSLLITQETTATAIYKSTVEMQRVLQILKEAKKATPSEQQVLRNELHNLLSTKYKIIQEQGVLGYHFVFENNKSFYRAHKPSKFGDDLSKIREDIKYVNKEKKSIRGFTQGKITQGFRNTFPIFDKDDTYLGALEISFSSDHFQWYLNEVGSLHSHFIIHKDIFKTKSWARNDIVLNYLESSESEKHILALNGGHTKEKCIDGNKARLQTVENDIPALMDEEESFSFYIEYRKIIIVASFLPIYNISDNIVAWIISYEMSPIIRESLHHTFILRMISLFLSLVFIYFLYHEISSNHKIQIQKQLLNEILDTTDNIMLITNFKSIKFSNYNFNQEQKKKPLSLFLESDGYLHIGLLKNYENFDSLIQRTPNEERIVSMKDSHLITKTYQISASKLKNDEDYLVTLTDITKLKEELIKNEKKASIDGLTQVYNRYKFDELLSSALQRAYRYQETLSVALFDIDKFKNFNDTYGHLIGDEVLVTTAQTVNNAVRETDVFARWGGEEFVVLFQHTNIEIAKKVSISLKDKIQSNEHPTAGKITASFGLTEYIEGDTIESIFKRCDDALYVAKENGRNRVEVL